MKKRTDQIIRRPVITGEGPRDQGKPEHSGVPGDAEGDED